MYNPLLGHEVRDRTWYDIAEALQVKIAYICLRGQRVGTAYHLNVLDLIDSEASAYWRDYGMELYSGKVVEVRRADRATTIVSTSSIVSDTDSGISIL